MKKLLLPVSIFLFFTGVSQTPLFDWAIKEGAGGGDGTRSTAVDNLGNVLSAGHFSGTVDFDPGPGVYNLTASGGGDAFVLKLNANGGFIWARQFSGTSSEGAMCVGVDAQNNVYSTGFFNNVVDFDPGPGTFTLAVTPGGVPNINQPMGNIDIFVSKLDAAGNFVWANAMGGNQTDYVFKMWVDAPGNVYTTGYYYGTCDFDPGPGAYSLTSVGGQDIYVSKLNTLGNFIWAKTIGGINNDFGRDIVVDLQGNVYSTGSFSISTVDFDPGPGTVNLTPVAKNDIYVLKLDGSGNFIWVKQISGNLEEYTESIALDKTGNILLAGWFYQTVDFDPGPGTNTFTAIGGFGNFMDLFVEKLDNNGNFIWARHTGAPNSSVCHANSCYADTAGDVYVTGHYADTCDFDPGPGTYKMNSNPNATYGMFVLKLSATGFFKWARPIASIDPGGGVAYSIVVDNALNIYVAGIFSGTVDFDPNLTTYTLTWGGGQYYDWDAFVTKWKQPCVAPPAPIGTNTIQTLCAGSSYSFGAIGQGTLNWYTSLTATSAVASGSTYLTPTLSTGTYSYYVSAFTCTESIRNWILLTVYPLPQISVSTSNSVICRGESSTLTASGANLYNWSTGTVGLVVTIWPSITSGFSVTGTDANGCSATTVFTQSVSLCAGLDHQTSTSEAIIAPNPNNGEFRIIGVNLNEGAVFEMYDYIGALVYRRVLVAEHADIIVSEFSSGVYIFTISQNNLLVKRGKIVVK